MEMIGISKREADALVALYDLWIKAGGITPTNRELGAALGIKSTSRTHELMVSLDRKGLIDREIGRRRSAVLSDKGMLWVETFGDEVRKR